MFLYLPIGIASLIGSVFNDNFIFPLVLIVLLEIFLVFKKVYPKKVLIFNSHLLTGIVFYWIINIVSNISYLFFLVRDLSV